jgi:hypothetical protein
LNVEPIPARLISLVKKGIEFIENFPFPISWEVNMSTLGKVCAELFTTDYETYESMSPDYHCNPTACVQMVFKIGPWKNSACHANRPMCWKRLKKKYGLTD